jgi:hypothetical protein
MHGISKSKHEHLIESLLLLEKLLSEEQALINRAKLELDANGVNVIEPGSEHQLAAGYREELTQIYAQYNTILVSLSEVIERYDKLFNHVRLEYVSKKLKELKRKVNAGEVRFDLLKDNIHIAYGISD